MSTAISETIKETKSGIKLKVTDLFFLVMIFLGLYVGIAKPWVSQLNPTGHLVLMALIFTIAMWIFKPFNIPISVAGCLFLLFTLALNIAPAKVFSGFTSTAEWTLIPALFFGYVLLKTGLGKRIGYMVIKMFNPSYPLIILSFVIIGLVLSALTPSMAVRVVIIVPIAISIVEACGLELKSKGSALILLSAWVVSVLPGNGWVTGSLLGPIILGLYNAVPDLNGVITFGNFSQVAFLPLEILSVLLIVGGYFALKPEKPMNLTKEYFQEQYNKLGSISRNEIISAVVLICCCIMFATSRIHHIPDATTCLAGVFLLTAAGVINGKEISTGISWDIVIFIGVSLSFGAVFADTGISKWLVGVLVPLIEPLTKSPWVFSYTLLILFFIIRFFDTAVFIPTMSILVPIIPEISRNFGINPLAWIPIFLIVANSFFLSYTNMFAMVAESITNERSWTVSQMGKYGLVYFIASLITLAVSVPYWISIGMFR